MTSLVFSPRSFVLLLHKFKFSLSGLNVESNRSLKGGKVVSIYFYKQNIIHHRAYNDKQSFLKI